MPAEIEIRPVATRAEREAFIRLPGRLMADDPAWVEPLHAERRQHIDPARNPFFRHAEVELWLAWRGTEPVGRISAQLDRLAPPVEGRSVGFWGMPAACDTETLGALLATAERWLADRGAGLGRGPFSLSVNETSGLLVDGFDTPPYLLMAHDPAWMGAAVEGCGWSKGRDLVAYVMDVSRGLPDRPRRIAERSLAEGVTLRPLDRRRFADEIRMVTAIFNDAWAGNWGFVPLTEAEIDAMAAELKPILDSELVCIAEIDGAPAGFIVLLPNINEAIGDLGGRLLPFGWAKLLWRLKVRGLRTGRVPLMGVTRPVAATVLGKTLPLLLIYALEERARARGIDEIELSWLLEDNLPVRRLIESLGGRLTKTWRVYEKVLA
ncbi:N-acetyltransferase [Limibaculum sp. M0105]|uniref:N-acetyltransferase n=1 Tax=Thermohalobaculum xanthum TaxID=2753746 RepID=A0A8J7SDU9_9RHOB|nr:N-acetyltransferase [Thermohalobaculum xanthum]MBK0400292.1 N-acetyltransferase [Thermohalobaculum xanthum]